MGGFPVPGFQQQDFSKTACYTYTCCSYADCLEVFYLIASVYIKNTSTEYISLPTWPLMPKEFWLPQCCLDSSFYLCFAQSFLYSTLAVESAIKSQGFQTIGFSWQDTNRGGWPLPTSLWWPWTSLVVNHPSTNHGKHCRFQYLTKSW